MSVGEPFRADLPRLGRCTDEMRGMSEEVVSMFDDFEAGVRLFSPWTGDGTDRPSQQFQMGWDERNKGIRAVGDPTKQAVVGVIDSTLSNMHSIRGTSEYAQDEIRGQRSRADSAMDDLDSDSGYGSDSDSDTRH
ncbi:hypothetical protein OG562_33815 [Streptomyces sp. NBC_01275]|uniref:hypothetical protein n=1 Tax=Streptomyces sp. NBC_01275 TaxID=2903807 RepID=UPI00225B9F35|nr:hypothetical protein [Streptomyces sp. NBC_01275]MCX4765870.1 hypothetical protein [Streptomyces sp. NBC_01275]